MPPASVGGRGLANALLPAGLQAIDGLGDKQKHGLLFCRVWASSHRAESLLGLVASVSGLGSRAALLEVHHRLSFEDFGTPKP